MKNPKFVSIVVCTFNRAENIVQSIKSLLNQDYPKDLYEIIVVDDGSSDNTRELVSKYPIKFIRHQKNLGISASRNSGLKASKGDIYVCFDDDCVADKDWLRNIVRVFEERGNINGVCGLTVPGKNMSIMDEYLDQSDYTNPSPMIFSQNTNILYRFITYLISMINPPLKEIKEITQVYEVYGANSSFPTKILREIGGWVENLSGVEDTDLCTRIRNKHPENKFFINPNAKIIHNHELSFIDFVQKPFKRGLVNLKYYQKNCKFPPIFPFPCIYLLLVLLALLDNPITAVITLILIPQIMYFWWIIRFFKTLEFDYLLFPYIQLSYETMVIAGLIRGYATKT